MVYLLYQRFAFVYTPLLALPGKRNQFISIMKRLILLTSIFLAAISSFCKNNPLEIAYHHSLIPEETTAVSANEFLNSMGACSSVSKRGETIEGTIECMRYTGLRWLRVGYEDNAPVEDFIRLHNEAGTKFSYGLLSGKSDIDRLIRDSKQLAAVGALIAVEGANEPNNWGITYQEETGGNKASWLPVAKLHRDLYRAVKNSPGLNDIPIWGTTETGAQTDNVGLHFLTIPENANTLMPPGTVYADYANCHNYVSHPNRNGLFDNQTWNASDPSKECKVDGLHGNYGQTWLNKFPGYPEEELLTLPRVTTETGIAINPSQGITEEIQARMYLNIYLSQFKRGWKQTAIYLLKGRSNEPEHEKFAFFKLDYTPKQAARYVHNFTTILADDKEPASLDKISYSIPDKPETTHDLLLQKSNGHLFLVLWGERFGSGGSDNITVQLGKKYREVNIYDPTVGTSVLKRFTHTEFVTLSLSDHPVIIEFY